VDTGAVIGSLGFAGFGNGNPDDFIGTQDCVDTNAQGVWDDTGCNGLRAFVCQLLP
jgi:hypothetical protein